MTITEKILKDIQDLNNDETQILTELDIFKDVKGWVPTGIASLNLFLDTPGFPLGNVVEISGPEQSGKTTLTWHTIGAIQRQFKDYAIIVIATERRSRSGYPSVIGVDESKVIVVKPTTIEEAFASIEYWIAELRKKHGEEFPIIFIWDSIGGTPTKAEVEGESDDNFMAIAARVIKKNLRRLVQLINDQKSILIIINQVYDKMQVAFGGKKTTTFGGRAIKYHSSVRLQLNDTGQIKVGDVKVGQNVDIEMLKSDFSSPRRKLSVPLLFGIGFVPSKRDLVMAEELKILRKYKTGYEFVPNPKINWRSEADYYKLMMDNASFRKKFCNLLELKYKIRILKQRGVIRNVEE